MLKANEERITAAWSTKVVLPVQLNGGGGLRGNKPHLCSSQRLHHLFSSVAVDKILGWINLTSSDTDIMN